MDLDALAAAARNADVRWDGSYVGLRADVIGEASKALLVRGREAVPTLYRMLDDADRFVAAHVVLSELGLTGTSVSSSSWNGLKVVLHADGRVTWDTDARHQIKREWTMRLRRRGLIPAGAATRPE
jgi:hypothetical protein